MSSITETILRSKKERKARPIVHDLEQRLRQKNVNISDFYSDQELDELRDVGIIGGAPSKRDANGFTPGQIKRADAYEKFHERRRVKGDDEDEDEAIKIVAKEMKIKPGILRKVVAHNRVDVNPVLRHRGLMP
ncbi:hypothetical protein BH10PSE10_BH10PSE10_02850 [soil metagenome]